MYVECLGDSSWRENMDILEKAQQRATDIVKGLEHMTYTGSLRKLALFSMKKGGLKGTLLMWISIGKGKVQRRQSQDLFRTGPKDSGRTLKQLKLGTHWNKGSHYEYGGTFTVKVTEPWNKLPRELLRSHLEILKSHLDVALLEHRDSGPDDLQRCLPIILLWFCDSG